LSENSRITDEFLATSHPLSFRNQPDLREHHHRLVGATSSETLRCALVNEETDRITNSLNTLREQIVQWNRFPE
jgi:hypothetical protein